MIGFRRISLDQLLLRGSTAAVAVERAVAPLRTGETVPCCEHLTPELEAASSTMGVVCVECPGGAETLHPFIVDLTVREARGSVILIRLVDLWSLLAGDRKHRRCLSEVRVSRSGCGQCCPAVGCAAPNF